MVPNPALLFPPLYTSTSPVPPTQLSGFGPHRRPLSAQRLKGSRRVAAACYSMASRYKVNVGETDKQCRILVWEGTRRPKHFKS